MSKSQMILVFSIILTLIVCFGAWVANIVALAHSGIEPLTAMIVLRIVGIFVVPVGIVMGFL